MEPYGSLPHSHNKVKIPTWTGKLHRKHTSENQWQCNSYYTSLIWKRQ